MTDWSQLHFHWRHWQTWHRQNCQTCPWKPEVYCRSAGPTGALDTVQHRKFVSVPSDNGLCLSPFFLPFIYFSFLFLYENQNQLVTIWLLPHWHCKQYRYSIFVLYCMFVLVTHRHETDIHLHMYCNSGQRYAQTECRVNFNVSLHWSHWHTFNFCKCMFDQKFVNKLSSF